MIDTILFDMGGTLEDIHYSTETIDRACTKLIAMLEGAGLAPHKSLLAFWNTVNEGICSYKQWSEGANLEKKPEEIWPDYYLRAFDFDRDTLTAMAEDLAGMWEVTFYHRELRPGVHQMLDDLKARGYKLGVISNTASLYSVFDVLEGYGIRDYFQDVTLSSVTGYRKPHPELFRISLRQMQSKAENCLYVGDTLSRDIIGAKQAGFGAAVQIKSFLTRQKDCEVPGDAYKPDHIIENFEGFAEYVGSLG